MPLSERCKLLIQRSLAFSTDFSIVGSISWALIKLLENIPPGYQRFLILEPLIIWAVYGVISIRLIGGTIGMWTWDIELKRLADGKRPEIKSILLRHFASILSLAVLGLGYIWVLGDSRGRTWHDILSGTIVLERKSGNC